MVTTFSVLAAASVSMPSPATNEAPKGFQAATFAWVVLLPGFTSGAQQQRAEIKCKDFTRLLLRKKLVVACTCGLQNNPPQSLCSSEHFLQPTFPPLNSDSHWPRFSLNHIQLSAFQLSARSLSAFQLSARPLSAFQLSAFQLSAFQLSAFQLSAFQLSAFQLSAFQLSAFQLSAFQLSAFQLSAFQLSAFQLSVFQLLHSTLAFNSPHSNSAIPTLRIPTLRIPTLRIANSQLRNTPHSNSPHSANSSNARIWYASPVDSFACKANTLGRQIPVDCAWWEPEPAQKLTEPRRRRRLGCENAFCHAWGKSTPQKSKLVLCSTSAPGAGFWFI